MTGRVQHELFHRGRFESPFFRSKFRVPAAPRHFVRRARLLELLDDLAAYPVTAVVAPAGAGKTVLAADWTPALRKTLRLAGPRRVGPRRRPVLRGADLGRRLARAGHRRPSGLRHERSLRTRGSPPHDHRPPRADGGRRRGPRHRRPPPRRRQPPGTDIAGHVRGAQARLAPPPAVEPAASRCPGGSAACSRDSSPTSDSTSCGSPTRRTWRCWRACARTRIRGS